MEHKEYMIGGRIFVQRPLVLGQIDQILDLMGRIRIPAEIGASGLVGMLAKDGLLARALAVILTEKGTKVRDKDLEGLTSFFAEEVDFATALEAVACFFEINRPESILNRLTELTEGLRKTIGTRFPSSSPSSPAETLPSGKISSGGSPTPNVGHT